MKKKYKIARFLLFMVLILGIIETTHSQNKFQLPEKDKHDKIGFELVNNLVVIPVEINGTELSFLLDTGVNATILFSVDQKDSLELRNTRPIRIRGLGEGGSIEALRSSNNTVKIGAAENIDHTIYVIFESSLNLSPRMGLPVHGIIGYDFFKDFVVKTDYIRKKLIFSDPTTYTEKECSSCEFFDIVMYENKPYVDITIANKLESEEVTLLIDSGSSDALWLFDETNTIVEDPKNYFEDFLGLGLSGNIFGKRSKLEQANFGNYSLQDVNVAFPSAGAMDSIQFYGRRKGSLGGDILRRFTVIMDYGSKKMILRKNANFNDPFYYNMSGLTVEHDGLSMVKDEKTAVDDLLNIKQDNKTVASVNLLSKKVYSFFLAPKFVIADVREGSPGARAGIQKGDEIISINNRFAYRYKLYELFTLFSTKVGKTITMIIERNGIQSKVKFDLKEVL